MVRLTTLIIAMVFAWVMIPSEALAGAVVAKANGVKVHAEASNSSSVVTEIKKGESLEAMERKGLFWQVKTKSGQKGFVSILKVKRQADASSGSISQAIRAASEDGRSDGDEVENARARSAVMGVRGLDESSETQYAGNTKPNLRLVYQMEDRRVSKKKVSKLENQVMNELEKLSK